MWNYLTSGLILTLIKSTLINIILTELAGEVLRTHTGVGANSVLLHAREINDNDNDIPSDGITHRTSGSIHALVQASLTLINIHATIIPLKPCKAVAGV